MAGLLRRLAAAFYDALLLFSVLFFGTVLILPAYGGHAVPPGDPLYSAYLLGLAGVYFGWFWTHGGQTPGMKPWRMRLRDARGGGLGWGTALLRFAAAMLSWLPCGAGFLWSALDRRGLTWHDRLSGSWPVVEPRRAPGADVRERRARG